MRTRFAKPLLAVYTVSTMVSGQTRAAPLDIEFAFRCGALFGILEQVYAALGETEQAFLYGSRYQILKAETEKLHESSDAGREQAKGERQRYVSELAPIMADNPGWFRS